MSSGDPYAGASCPPLERLISATAGDLSFVERARLLGHLLRCAACRMELRELEVVLAAVREEDRQRWVWDGDPCEPSRQDFLVRLHAQERALAARGSGLAVRRWIAVAAMVPVLVVASLLSRTYVAVLQADELLRRAVVEEGARHPGTVQKYRLQLAPDPLAGQLHATPSLLFGEASEDTADAPSFGPGASPAVGNALRLYPFDWRRPLSVKQYLVWRRAQEIADDDVIRTREGLLLRTSVRSDGHLRAVDLLVREDYHAIRLTLHLTGLGRVDVEEMTSRVERPGTPAPAGEGVVAAGMPTADALEEAELDLRLALQRVEVVPSRDSVQLARMADAVRLDGSLPSPAARDALLESLASHPHIRTSVTVQPATPPVAPRTGVGMSRWLVISFADDATRVRFVTDLDRQVSAVVRRLAGLTELVHRYPARASGALSPTSRAKLARLASGQRQALAQELLDLRTQLTALVGPTSRRARGSLGDWRTLGSRASLRAATLAERLSAVMAQERPIGPSDAAELTEAFDDLWEGAHGRP